MSTVTHETRVNASAEKVWKVLADFGNVYRWAPNVLESYSITEDNEGVGTARHCEVADFGGLDETVIDWNDGLDYTFEIFNVGPIKKAISTWAIRSDGSDVIVTTTIRFETKFGPLGALMDRLLIRRNIRNAMVQAQAGLKHNVETGEVVGNELPQAAAA